MGVCLLPSFLLLTTRQVRELMAFWCFFQCVESRESICLKCLGDDVDDYVVSGDAEAFYVMVFALGQEMGPWVSVIFGAQCAVGVGVSEWPRKALSMVSHILHIVELRVCVYLSFPKIVGQSMIDLVI